MEAYRLYNVVPQLFDFIEDLTNWYIRLNRTRYWGEDITADKIAAFSTLHTALYELCQVMAPFAPFLAEHIYRQLGALGGGSPTPVSVHLCDYPEGEASFEKADLEKAVASMQEIVLLGRQKREEARIGLRTPLRSLTVVHRDAARLEELEPLEPYLRAELNVQEIRYDTDEAAHIEVVARPNFPLLGKRLGKRMKSFQQAIRALDATQLGELVANGRITVDGEVFTADEIEVQQQPRPGTNTVSNGRIAVDLDITLDDELVRGGYAREIVNRIQRRRKDLDLNVADRIEVHYWGDPDLLRAAAEHGDYVRGETLSVRFEPDETRARDAEVEIDGRPFRFSLNAVVAEVD
jgi:isoleucyl-tRNA synthetase